MSMPNLNPAGKKTRIDQHSSKQSKQRIVLPKVLRAEEVHCLQHKGPEASRDKGTLLQKMIQILSLVIKEAQEAWKPEAQRSQQAEE